MVTTSVLNFPFHAPAHSLAQLIPIHLSNAKGISLQSRRISLVVVPIQPVLLGHVAVNDILLNTRNTRLARELVRLSSQQAVMMHFHRYGTVSIHHSNKKVNHKTYW
jgi:hypothetical protein